jgi:heme-degrading monooxygenase HmoA
MTAIVRAWRARAPLSNPEGYPRHFRTNVIPHLEAIDGFLGASLLGRRRQDDIEFLVLTRWATLGVIKAFAGSDIARAVVEPAAIAVLASFDETVRHFEVVEEVNATGV